MVYGLIYGDMVLEFVLIVHNVKENVAHPPQHYGTNYKFVGGWS